MVPSKGTYLHNQRLGLITSLRADKPDGFLHETGVGNAERVSEKVAKALVEYPNWQQSEADLRELRKAATFAAYAEMDDPDEVATIVEKLLGKLLSTAGGAK